MTNFNHELSVVAVATLTYYSLTVEYIERQKMNWVQRKIYLYNVTFGLYMLDWWERFLFNILVVALMWFVCYNGVRYASELYKGSLQ